MITIYTVPNCDKCKEVKAILDKRLLDYEEINLKLKENREARAFYRKLGVKTAPIIVDDEWMMTEYNERELEEHIDEKE